VTARNGIVRAVAMTGRGSVRTRNEDALLIFDWLSQAPRPQLVELRSAFTPPLICAVADGLGGHPAGAAASRLALTRLIDGYPDWTDAAAARDGLLSISEAVYETGRRHPDTDGMRTTVAGVLIHHDRLLCFNVGDSRAYRITDGYLEQISTDDAVLDSDGRPTDRVTQTVGDPPQTPPTPHITDVPLDAARPTRLLLCTDGVTGPVALPLLRRACRERQPARIVRALRDAAYHAGAPDNLSAAVIDIPFPPASP
jgi:protein phosphatase